MRQLRAGRVMPGIAGFNRREKMTDHSPSRQIGLNLAQDAATAVKTPAFPSGLPRKQGLYDPRNEHDACGVGFVAHLKGEKSHQIVRDGLFMLENLTH
ncbi:hypothetical protein CN098_29215, partial [Sinorhizobium meliloti]